MIGWMGVCTVHAGTSVSSHVRLHQASPFDQDAKGPFARSSGKPRTKESRPAAGHGHFIRLVWPATPEGNKASFVHVSTC